MIKQVQEYQIKEQISWEEAVSIGLELREAKDNSQWKLGDLAMQIDTVYGTDAIGKFAIEIGVNKKSLMQYRRISAAFPPELRVAILSHRHHLMLAPRPDRLEWLKKAEENNWSVLQLARELAIADGNTPTDLETPPETHRCDSCHHWKMETDDVCHCYRLN